MPFPRKLLTSGEEIVVELRPHWKALVGPVLWTAALGALTGVLFAKIGGDLRGPLRLILAAGALVAWWLIAGLRLLRWFFTEYVLTNERLIARSGVIAKMGKEIPLERINDITFRQSVLDRFLGSGDLVLESAGELGQTTFDDIPNPAEMQKQIYATAEEREAMHRGAGGLSVADELSKLADLRDRGVLTAEEFEARKRRLLES